MCSCLLHVQKKTRSRNSLGEVAVCPKERVPSPHYVPWESLPFLLVLALHLPLGGDVAATVAKTR